MKFKEFYEAEYTNIKNSLASAIEKLIPEYFNIEVSSINHKTENNYIVYITYETKKGESRQDKLYLSYNTTPKHTVTDLKEIKCLQLI